MARIALTASPVDIIAANAELDGTTTYSAQAEFPLGGLVHIDDGDNQPESDIGHKFPNLASGRVKAGSGGKLWAWAPGVDDTTPAWLNLYEEP